MTGALPLRLVVLAGVALVAVVAGLAVAAAAGDGEPSRTPPTPRGVPVAGTGWYDALAAPYRPQRLGRRTACGHRAGARLLGVGHPVLPCGAKIILSLEGATVLTQVVDRGRGVPGREFDVTAALAARIGLTGIQPVRWRFAAAPETLP
jgi:hypothetical protein